MGCQIHHCSLLQHAYKSGVLICGVVTGIANAPAASSLDALWAKLQQQHSLEAEAARMTRRANSGSLPLDSTANPTTSSSAPVQQAPVVPANRGEAPGSRGTGQATQTSSASAAPQQQFSEADFWKLMQK